MINKYMVVTLLLFIIFSLFASSVVMGQTIDPVDPEISRQIREGIENMDQSLTTNNPEDDQITLDPMIQQEEPIRPREVHNPVQESPFDPLHPTQSMDDIFPGWADPSPDPVEVEPLPGGNNTVPDRINVVDNHNTSGNISQPGNQDSQQAPSSEKNNYSGSSSNVSSEGILTALENLQPVYLAAGAEVEEIAPAMLELLSTGVETSVEGPKMENAVVDNDNTIKPMLPWLFLGGGLLMTTALFIGVFLYRRSL